jgi:cytochrome d ubiquinol oxidase subunit II
MELTTVWFALIAILWLGYLVLEGFDFGVGMLLAVLARDDRERRVLLNTIGPVWDGNEVWLIVAVGATFAAFPEWYATLFSGFYLPLLAILATLIVRAVGLEYRHKRADITWKQGWDRAIVAGSVVPPFLWGLVLANVVRGVPLDADHDFVGSLGDLLTPYALLGGAAVVALSLTHGAFFVALKTVGDIRSRARGLALRSGGTTLTLLGALVAWTALRDGDLAVWAAGAVGVIGLAGGLAAGARAAEGWAFAGTALAIAALVAVWFLALFPDVMPSTLDPAGTLTTTNAASSPYTLQIMSWVALAFTPIVIGYQAWSYWVFRRRIGTHHIPA